MYIRVCLNFVLDEKMELFWTKKNFAVEWAFDEKFNEFVAKIQHFLLKDKF